MALDELQSRLVAYYARPGAGQPPALGELAALSGGWASEVYTFTLQPHASATTIAQVLKTYAPTAHGQAHAAREWRALEHLRAVGYPVPRARIFEPDERQLGRPFVVMDHVPGRQLWGALEAAEPATRDRLTRLFVARLLDLHALDPAALADAPHQPFAFVDHELAHLRRAVEASHYPALRAVVGWLARQRDSVPCARPAIVHRDYHPWNVLVDPAEQLYVLDWDWSIGDARFDLAWTLMLMRRSGFDAFSDAVHQEYARQSDRALDQLGYFEVLTSLRWLLNVTQALEPGAALRDGARDEFRDFLIAPVGRAVAFLRARTGAEIQVEL